MKIINAILAILLILFAYLQLNDPDALTWGTIYSVTALISALAIFDIRNKWLTQIFLFSGIVYLLFLLPDLISAIQNYNSDLPNSPEVTHTANVQTETFKEFFGLLICLLVLIFQYWQEKRLDK